MPCRQFSISLLSQPENEKAPADRSTVVAKKKKLPVEQEMPSDHSVPASPSDHVAADADQHEHCECVETLSVKLESGFGS